MPRLPTRSRSSSPQELPQTAGGEKFGPGSGRRRVIDRQRRFVARIPDHEAEGRHPCGPDWREEIERSPQEGFAETVRGRRPIPDLLRSDPLWLDRRYQLPARQPLCPVTRQLWMMVGFGAMLVFLAIAIAYAMARRITAPAAALVDDARHLAEGKVVSAPRVSAFRTSRRDQRSPQPFLPTASAASR